MKTNFNLFSAGVLTLALVSCSTGDKSGQTEESAEVAESTYSMTTASGVIHDVADFDAWNKVFLEVSDPKSRIAVLRGVENPSTVFVLEWSESHEAAKADYTGEELKKVMAEAGVNSEPQFSYYDMVPIPETDATGKFRLTIAHEVSDYASWKTTFDADESRRSEAGLALVGMATDADNPNMVYMMFATDDMEGASAMLSSEDLQAKMKEAGVISEPVVSWWTVASGAAAETM